MKATTGGVGLMLSKEAQRMLISLTSTSDHVIIVSFKSNTILTNVVAYIQMADKEKVKFYSNPGQAVKVVPVHNILTILCDFNAQLGHEDVAFTYHQEKMIRGFSCWS